MVLTVCFNSLKSVKLLYVRENSFEVASNAPQIAASSNSQNYFICNFLYTKPVPLFSAANGVNAVIISPVKNATVILGAPVVVEGPVSVMVLDQRSNRSTLCVHQF